MCNMDNNPRCWRQRAQSVPIPLTKKKIPYTVEGNQGPGHCNKYMEIETTPCLVRWHESKGGLNRGRDIWRTYTNPYQFDRSHVQRVDNFLQKAAVSREDEKIRAMLPGIMRPTALGSQKPIDPKLGNRRWDTISGKRLPDGGPCENWTSGSISTRSQSQSGCEGYFETDYLYTGRSTNTGGGSSCSAISERSYHSVPERQYSIRKSQSYEFTNKPPIVHQRSRSGVRKSGYQNTVVEIKRDMPGYQGYIPGTAAENMLGKTWSNIVDRSAQMRGPNGVSYDGVNGFIPTPDRYPVHRYPNQLANLQGM